MHIAVLRDHGNAMNPKTDAEEEDQDERDRMDDEDDEESQNLEKEDDYQDDGPFSDDI